MALSRAAAAAARKAAKSRGLQGNRAEDGSMLTAPDDISATLHMNRTPEQVAGLSDAKLIEARADAIEELKELQDIGTKLQERNWLGADIEKYNTELAAAKNRLEVIDRELENREGAGAYPEGRELPQGEEFDAEPF